MNESELHEKFAMCALVGLLAGLKHLQEGPAAKVAWDMADAMMEERRSRYVDDRSRERHEFVTPSPKHPPI